MFELDPPTRRILKTASQLLSIHSSFIHSFLHSFLQSFFLPAFPFQHQIQQHQSNPVLSARIMAVERSTERAPSVSSSITETDAYDDDEKNGAPRSTHGNFIKLKTPDEIEAGDDIERAALLPGEHEKAPEPKLDNSTKVAAAWMIVNTLATIGIVCRQKRHLISQNYANSYAPRSSPTRQSFQIRP